METLTFAYADDKVSTSTKVKTSGDTADGVGDALEIFPLSSRRPPGRARKSMILATREIRVIICR